MCTGTVQGADIIPMYFFGNTTVLTIPKSALLENISRVLQVSITIFWGRWFLPIPRPHKVIIFQHLLMF
jgi:hypothetical protein